MPSIASESCHITSGCSGLPKLRQSTSATGRPPAQATLSTDSATVAAAPARGSIAHQPGLASVESASALARPGHSGAGEAEHGGVGLARAEHGVQEELVVVLAEDEGRVVAERQQIGTRIRGSRRGRRARAAVVPRGRPVARAGGRSGGRRRRASWPGPRRGPRRSAPARTRSRPVAVRAVPRPRRPTTLARISNLSQISIDARRGGAARRWRASAPGSRSS